MLSDTREGGLWHNLQYWGSRAEERQGPFPCDSWLSHPDQALFRAVTVEASAETIFRWLCQLKLAPYSYDWIDNLGRKSPPRLVPGCEQLERGQRVMFLFELVDFQQPHHLTLLSGNRWLGEVAVSYCVHDHGSTCRLVVKLLMRYPRGPLGWLMRLGLPLGDLLMMRKQLLTLKQLAEQTPL